MLRARFPYDILNVERLALARVQLADADFNRGTHLRERINALSSSRPICSCAASGSAIALSIASVRVFAVMEAL
jgi:hypothetical protein